MDIRIKCVDNGIGEKVDCIVKGIKIGDHLAIHREIKRSTGEMDPKGKFVITHLKTGYIAFPMGFLKRKNALIVANQIKDLDWHFDDPRSPKLRDLRDPIMDLRNRVNEMIA